MTTSDTDCELKKDLASSHSDLVSGIKDVHADVKDCHEGKEKASKVAEQRRLATEAYREKRSQSNLSLIESLHKFMEGQDARRKETMMAASSQPDCQEIMDELQLHHARVQNIISESLLSPQSDTKSLLDSPNQNQSS